MASNCDYLNLSVFLYLRSPIWPCNCCIYIHSCVVMGWVLGLLKASACSRQPQ